MSQISESVAKTNESLNIISGAVDDLVTSVAGITGDVDGLKEIIAKMQNGPGPISPEDQALLNSAETLAATVATKTQAVANAAKLLDLATEAVVPAV